MLDQLKVPLGYRRSIGDTHYYHVRSTLGSFRIQKINRRSIPLPCQINFRFLWDTEDQQEIHTITMLDQLLSLQDTEGQQEIHTITMLDQLLSLQDTEGRKEIHTITMLDQLLSLQDTEDQQEIHTITMLDQLLSLQDTEDQQEIHTITMLDQLKVPLGYRRSIGRSIPLPCQINFCPFRIQKINRRSISLPCQINFCPFRIQKINRRYTPLPCQINFRFLQDTEDQQEIHTITMLDQLKVPLGYRRSIGDTHYYHVRST